VLTEFRSALESIHFAYLLKGGELSLTKHAGSSWDLIDIGIAALRQLPDRSSVYRIDEPLVFSAIANAAKKLGLLPTTSALARFEDMIHEDGPRAQGKGKRFEKFMVADLIERAPVLVADFVRPFLGEGDILPDWTYRAVLDLKRYASAAALKCTDDVEACQLGEGVAVEPSTAMRPDLFALAPLDGDYEHCWALAASFKIQSTRLDDSKQNDLRSTDRSKLFWKADGTAVNPDCSRKASKMQALLAQRKVVGSLRIHAILPGVVGGARSRVNGNDVIVYLDQKNLLKFLCGDQDDNVQGRTARALALATNTKPEGWRRG
jgi:hypothetical protein